MYKKSLSVVIPTYNESNRIKKCLIEVNNYLKINFIDYEIIVSDDGSYDNTSNIVKNIYKSLKIKNGYILDNIHKGKGHAVKQGVLKSTKKYILVTDCDLSTPINTLNSFFNQQNFDVIIASRNLKDSIVERKTKIRDLMGKTFSYFTNIIFNLNIKDTQCGFKLFPRDIKFIFKKLKTKGFSYDVEVLYWCKYHGLKIQEYPIVWIHDEDSRVKPFYHAIKMLKELILIWLNIHSNIKRYIRFAFVGLIGTLCSGIILYTFTEWFKFWYIISFIFGTFIGSVVNYILNKKFVWNDYKG